MRTFLISMLAAAVSLPAVAQTRFEPVMKTEFADPFVLPWGGGYFAYATNAPDLAANVQMAVSKDRVHWEPLKAGSRLHDALPVLPRWAEPGRTWAPEVLRMGARYVLYFTARERRSGLQCVGVALSDGDPRGPFKPVGEAPLVCQRDLGGTIDPSPYRDTDGSLYLLFKNDGNNPLFLKPDRIFIQPLTPDGLALSGQPTELIRNDQHWEWRVVESPSMVRDPKGGYVLLYSANHFGWEMDQKRSNYAIGYAKCATVTGPCVKPTDQPILMSEDLPGGGCLSGPGHQTLFDDGGQERVAFHAWASTAKCQPAAKERYMYLGNLAWKDGAPVIEPPSTR